MRCGCTRRWPANPVRRPGWGSQALPKRIFTPIMGTALLIGIVSYLQEMAGTRKVTTG